MPQMAGLIHILHLCVRQSGDAMGTPVDDTASFVDQSFFIQGDKDLPDSLGAAFVHGKPGPVPVAGNTQLLLLLHDTVAILLLPIPNPFQELLPAQVISGEAILTKLLLHLDLSSDAGVIHAGEIQRFIPLHPLEADQRVLKGIIHGMANVQLAGNIGWRHHNGKGLLAAVRLGVEVTTLLPHIVNLALDLLRLINLW